MTHQLHIFLPRGWRWAEGLAERLHARVCAKYKEVWIPDYEEKERSLSGELGHPKISNFKFQISTPFAMLTLQEELERQCWLQANRRQTAPAQRMTDFVNKRLSADLPSTSYAAGLIASPLHFWMPPFLTERLREAFLLWGRHHHGFLTGEATVIAIETRTSSPVRILRDGTTLCHVRVRGLYPCGEGAGYAGGIVSAAIDGERCADAVAQAGSDV